MCGIIGYIGKNKVLPILIDGLTSLEYRGYDSAGVSYVCDGMIKTVKSEGQLNNLEKLINCSEHSYIGIGHTRWATHGKPSEINSHPHTAGNITLVHNGIIENYFELKKELCKKGYIFLSDTDSEVAAALLDYFYNKSKDMLKAIQLFKKKVKGSYAISLLCKKELDKLYVIKNLSPLIIGKGKDENFVASDVPAILKYTKDYITLDDKDYGYVNENCIELYNDLNEKKLFNLKTYDGDEEDITKNGFEHFMLKEIYEEPEIIKNALETIKKNNCKNLFDLKQYKAINIVACGSAMHAGYVGKYLIEKELHIPVKVYVASEFRYGPLFIDGTSLVIAISQSGETADTLAAVKLAKSLKSKTLGIVNVKESSIAREVDEVVYTNAGIEIAVATTKAYLVQIFTFISLVYNDKIFKNDDYKKIPIEMEKTINNKKLYHRIAKFLKDKNSVFFIGRQIDYYISLEGSLKMKEITYINSEAFPAGELKHGTISLIENNTPVVVILTDETIAEKTISNVKEVKSRGAYVILIVKENLNVISDVYDEKIVLPNIDEKYDSLFAILPLQLLAYETAKEKGCSIDKPKNLAKSVTVE